ncbi:tetratricopeptide repeat protein [Streptomyces sp. S6]
MWRQDWIGVTEALFEEAVFGGDVSAPDRADTVLDAVEAPLCLTRGKLLHVRFLGGREEDGRELELFERAAELYERLGNVPGHADALFWIGCWHQVVRRDDAAGERFFERSYALAKSAGDRRTMSCAVRHLAFADRDAGRFEEARARFTESVALRREIGFQPGVAAGLVALARLAAETGDPSTASRHLDEAEAIAESCGAKAVSGWVEEARGLIGS